MSSQPHEDALGWEDVAHGFDWNPPGSVQDDGVLGGIDGMNLSPPQGHVNWGIAQYSDMDPFAGATDDASLAFLAGNLEGDLPVELRMNQEGQVSINKNVAFCNQAGWKPSGCLGVGDKPKGAGGRKYSYQCNMCGCKWTQIRP
eukprot:3116031-Prymnesium_polylepis.1